MHAETQKGIRTEYEDALSAILRFENGVIGTLEVNWLAAFKQRHLRMYCEYGTVWAQLGLPKFIDCSRDDDPRHTDFVDYNEEPEPLRAELAAFLRLARREEPPPVSADDAIAAMRVVEALVESARRGEAVRLIAARPAT